MCICDLCILPCPVHRPLAVLASGTQLPHLSSVLLVIHHLVVITGVEPSSVCWSAWVWRWSLRSSLKWSFSLWISDLSNLWALCKLMDLKGVLSSVGVCRTGEGAARMVSGLCTSVIFVRCLEQSSGGFLTPQIFFSSVAQYQLLFCALL